LPYLQFSFGFLEIFKKKKTETEKKPVFSLRRRQFLELGALKGRVTRQKKASKYFSIKGAGNLVGARRRGKIRRNRKK
jgi:hypothetical protein